MNWFKTMTLMAMLALWLPATNHCRLEQVPGLGFLACGDHEESTPRPQKECDSDGCAPVESGHYKTEDTSVTPSVPVCAADDSPPLVFHVETAHPPNVADFSTVASLELPGTWQFFFRTALPPRPPSLAS